MALGFFFTSCSDRESGLAGRWYKIEGSGSSIPQEIELLKNGMGVALRQMVSWNTENKRLYIGHPDLALVFDYKLSGSKLELTNDDGQLFVYTKNLGGAPALVGTWELSTRDGESVEGEDYSYTYTYNKDGTGMHQRIYKIGEEVVEVREVKFKWKAEKDLLYQLSNNDNVSKSTFTVEGETLTQTVGEDHKEEFKKK
jgi:hypothetical protein